MDVVIISHCICISNHHIVYFKNIKFYKAEINETGNKHTINRKKKHRKNSTISLEYANLGV